MGLLDVRETKWDVDKERRKARRLRDFFSPLSLFIFEANIKCSILCIPSNPGVVIFNLKTSFSVLFVSSYHNGTVTFCRNGNREKETSLTRGCIGDLSAISPQPTPNRKSICGDLHVMLIGREKPIFIFFYCPCSFPIRS